MLRLRSIAMHGSPAPRTLPLAFKKHHRRFVSDLPPAPTHEAGLVSWTHCIPVRLSRVRTPTANENVTPAPTYRDDILLLPMLHAGSPAYYDFVLDQVSSFLADKDEGTPSRIQGPGPMDQSSRIVIEGVSGSEDEARMQQAEWEAIAKDKTLQTYLNEAALKYLKESVARSPEFLSSFNAFCHDFRLQPESIPEGVLLEDFYFKPRLAARFSHLMTNPDLILRAASIPRQLLALATAEAPFGSTTWLLRPEVSAYRERLFLSDLINFFEGETHPPPITGTVLHKKSIGLWGNAHVTHLTRFLMEDHGFIASKSLHGFPFGWDPQTATSSQFNSQKSSSP